MLILQIFQQAHCVAGHTATIAGETKMLFGGGFYIDLIFGYLQDARNVSLHLGNVVLQLGFWAITVTSTLPTR